MVDRLVNSEANSRRITAVEGCFGASGQPLMLPGRVLVGEGVLVKMCRKKPKPRQFFLFNDILIYGSILIAKKRYNTQHVIPLEDVRLEDIQDDGDLKNGWLIKTRTKSFAVYAATETEKKEWMNHINRCITDLLTRSGKKAASDHAAVWVPDADAPVCMQCKKTQFSVIQRKHHCRNCGACVCGACSGKKWNLSQISRHPVRVCNHCYDTLSSSTALPHTLNATQPHNNIAESDPESSASEEETDDQQPRLSQEESTFYGSPPTASTNS